MAGAQRKPDTALIEEVAAEGSRYDFFAAVQLLHRLRADAVPLGRLGPVRDEPLRFRHSTTLTFHSSDVESIQQDPRGVVLTSTFLGLIGATSPLGVNFTEDVISAEQHDEPTLRAFYDLFHHRLLSLFYGAWKKYRLHAGFRLAGDDSGTKRMLCFVGVDGHGAQAESGLSRLEVLELAPLLAMRARPPRVLELALQRVFPGVSAHIEQWVLRRAPIDRSDRMQLGRQNNRLGETFTLGAHVQDRSARFRVVLGPVDYETCESLMPGGAKYPLLRRVIEQFTRGTLECEVDVLLQQEQSLGYCLSSQRGGVLGLNTRLGHADGSTRRSLMRVLLTERPEDARPTLMEQEAS